MNGEKNDKHHLPLHSFSVIRINSILYQLHTLSLVAIVTSFAWISTISARAATAINPPWGLKLGHSAQRVETEIASAGLRISDKTSKQGRSTWTLDGFKQENLTGAKLHFDSRSRLEEVELQYGNPEWTSKQFEGFADFFLKKLQADFGPALLVERRTEQQNDVQTTIECHQWRREKMRLSCIRFSAQTIHSATTKKTKSQNSKKALPKQLHYDTISLHYRLMR